MNSLLRNPNGQEPNELFSTKEIEIATGLQRGTITNRAKLLGFERTGRGYTQDQVYEIVTYCRQHSADRQKAKRLRSLLIDRLEDDGLPMSILSEDGEGAIVYY